ncbi:hypothetical protein O6H91_04G124600 [Diphasiastrum complanatum]|uniref:Uncharacterized protein n=1 Tax=Diphasiastrum complanatum TaxID=34168 RepID=A0ACC2E1F6_DIPCM|nr:hypothetical protein O6H91_04G124600 [Diphasiastrum complanatum]
MVTSNNANGKDESTEDNGAATQQTDKPQRVRGSEVFVGGLQRNVTEENIRELFSDCGEIAEVRMMRDKNGVLKGYCFVRFTTRSAAFKAQKEKSGTIYQGKKIGVNPPSEHDTLFLGNLRKEWTAEELEKMVREVFEDVDSVGLGLPNRSGESPNKKQQNRGFAFVHFTTHAAAARAHRVATRPEFLLGGKWRPTVDWAESEPEPDPDEMAKVTTAFVGNLPDNVTDEYLQGVFEPFGKVERVAISRKGNTPVGFIQFAERAEMEASMKELDSKLIDGPGKGPKFKIQVSIAKPADKSRKRNRDDNNKSTHVNVLAHGKIGGTVGVLGSLGLPYTDFQDHNLGKTPRVLPLPFAVPEYDLAVASLKPSVADRLIRLFRQGFASRQEVDMHALEGLKELPESAAIKALDQFGASNLSDSISKSAYLTGLIDMARREANEKSGLHQVPSKATRPVDYPELGRATGAKEGRSLEVGGLPASRLSVVDQMSLPMAGINTDLSRYDPYGSLAIAGLFPSLSAGFGPEALLPRIPSAYAEPFNLPGVSSYAPGSFSNNLGTAAASQEANTADRRTVKFDPFTGEPYKFDPFTGQPIQTSGLSSSHLGGKLF